MSDYVHLVHIRVQHRHGSWSVLLKGTEDQIAKQIANHIRSGLGDGADKITLIPVKPHEVWDLEKNPPHE